MPQPLPTELWRLIFEHIPHETLYHLLFVTRHIQLITESALYEHVVLRPSERKSQLSKFSRAIHTADGRRSQYVKRLSLLSGHSSFPATEYSYIDNILSKLVNLEFLRCFIPFDNCRVLLLQDTPFSLKRLIWHKRPNNIAGFLSFLRSQRSLEHLELWHTIVYLDIQNNHLSPESFPRLRILQSSSAGLLRSLCETNRVTHLQLANPLSTFEVNTLSPNGRTKLESVRVLSCRGDPRHLIALASHLPNLEYWEVGYAYESYVQYGWPYLTSLLAQIGELCGTKLRYLRFTHNCLIDSTKVIRQSFAEIPTLRCVEVPTTDQRYHRRWYSRNGIASSATIRWLCDRGQEWWHDWERDVEVDEVKGFDDDEDSDEGGWE